MLDYQGFLTRLQQTTGWKLEPNGMIRRTSNKEWFGQECPVCALSKSFCLNATAAGIEIGLPYALIREFAMAADKSEGHKPEIRDDLLAACGLRDVA